VSGRLTSSIISASIFVFAAGSLALGAEWLAVIPLPAVPIPAGNLVAAVLYMSLAALTVSVTPSGIVARAIAWLLLAAAVLWLPVSIWLAGNLNLNFTTSDWRSELWMYYTVMALPGGCLLLLVWQLIHRAILQSRQSVPESDHSAERS
jgi:hypothetical protein